MRDTLGNRRLSFCLVFLLSVSGLKPTLAQAAQVSLAGTWRGNSICTVRNSRCHDEQNVYRISEVPGKPGWFSVTASKIVNGEEIVMGTGEWEYDSEKHMLANAEGGREIRLTVIDDRIEGSLTSGDTVYRRIYLKKDMKRTK